MGHFTIPRHIYIGKNALTEALPSIRDCGSRALIVTGPHISKSSMMDVVKRSLQEAGIAFAVFDRITGEPTIGMIEEGVSVYRKNFCEFCIGLGGGSPLDAAKAIAFMTMNTGSLQDYCGKEIVGEAAPVAAIPTTSGTGSEATRFTVITDEQRNIKMLLKGECMLPLIAVIDPGFSLDMPKSVTAATGLDALTHAIEAYTSIKAMPLTDALAVSAISRIMKNLPQAYANGADFKARDEMSAAALEAGICINNSSVTLVHGMSRPIGALFHVPHGLSNAMLLKVCMVFARDGACERFAALARVVGSAGDCDSDEVASDKFIQCIGELCEVCEVPSLTKFGIDKQEFFQVIEKMAADAILSGSPGNTRKIVTAEDCITIYKSLFP